jgi:hypothetical protein
MDTEVKNSSQNITWLHRACGVKPGFAPRFASSKSFYAGFGLFVLVDAGLLLLAAIFWRTSPLLALLCVATVIVLAVAIEFPFSSAERFARARIRRGECPICGQQLVGAHLHCPKCDA